MKLRKIASLLGATVIAAAGAAFATGAATAAAAPASAGNVTTAWVSLGGNDALFEGWCTGYLITSRISSATPAYVAAYLYDQGQLGGCSVVLQRSSDGGKTWRQAGAKSAIPSMHYDTFASSLTTAVYDGPGYRARVCLSAFGFSRQCTKAITVGAGKGRPANPALPASFSVVDGGTSAGGASGWCTASLNSTTLKKERASSVDADFSSVRTPCVGWIEVSANKGETWTSRSPRAAFQGSVSIPVVQAFLGPQRDGTGHIARVCVQAPAVSKEVLCSRTW
jgi:hypothetical protein